ncbi:MAG: hypothetical protein ACYTFY_06580 [Planctomycetota bacterium]|jgi:hypothetical protein
MINKANILPFGKRPADISKCVTIAMEEGIEKACKDLGIKREEAEELLRWHKEENCETVVMHELCCEKNEVKAQEFDKGGEDLDSLPLVIKEEKIVNFCGYSYSIDRPGLYRFINSPHRHRNLIYIKDNDIVPLLSAISSLHVHGNLQNDETTERHYKTVLDQPWVNITCDRISDLGKFIMNDSGIEARRIDVWTLDKWNAYNDGHSLLEVKFTDKGWLLVDLDMGMLLKKNDKFMSVYETWQTVNEGGEFEFYKLCEKMIDPCFSNSHFNYAGFFNCKFKDENGIKDWYRRVFQTVIVFLSDSSWYLGPEEELKAYCGPDINVLPENEWVEKVYR